MSRWKALPTRKSQTPSSEPLPEAAAAPAESLPSAPPPGADSKRRSGGGGNGLFWVLGGTVLLGAVVVGVMIAWWVFFHIVVYVHVQNQPAGITLPNEFEATGTLTNILDVTLNGEITAAVPFKQQLAVPFHGRYDFDVEFTAQVPIKFDVGYDGTIPVDTSADVTIHTGINYKNLKALRNLKIKTAIPMKFQLPVNLNIPVNDTVDLTYKGPLSADIDQDLQAPVSTVLNARLPVNQTIRAPVTAAVPLKIVPEKKQVRLLISDLVVALRPSSMLSFSLTDDASLPERVDNPYGPRDHGE